MKDAFTDLMDAEGLSFPEAVKKLAATVDRVEEARKQAELAYEFSPNSYTHAAMVAMRNAERAIREKELAEWIAHSLFMSDGERRIAIPHPEGGYRLVKESDYERRKIEPRGRQPTGLKNRWRYW